MPDRILSVQTDDLIKMSSHPPGTQRTMALPPMGDSTPFSPTHPLPKGVSSRESVCENSFCKPLLLLALLSLSHLDSLDPQSPDWGAASGRQWPWQSLDQLLQPGTQTTLEAGFASWARLPHTWLLLTA